MRGHNLEVVGKVKSCRTIQDSAVLLHQFDKFHLSEIFRALKHHVLEQMGEPRSVFWLDSKSNIVIHCNGYCRRRFIL